MAERRRRPIFGSLGAHPQYAGAAQHAALTAAATNLDLSDASTKALVKRREVWQSSCWDVYDTIGEVHYALNYLGDGLSRLNLFVGVRPDRADQDPVPLVRPGSGEDDGRAQDDDDGVEVSDQDAVAALDALERIAAESGGHGDLLRELAINLTVAAECYLTGIADGTTERWDVRSSDEVKVGSDGTIRVYDSPTQPDNKAHAIGKGDYLIRIWKQHPRWSERPDSPLRAVLSSAEELLLFEQATRASARSRLSAGVLLVPEELDFAPADPTQDEGDGEATKSTLIDDMQRAMSAPIQDEGAASALVPMLLKGKADYLKEIRLVSMERPLDQIAEGRHERALRRIAQGLPVPPEIVTGMADVNHWSAWQISEDAFRGHMEPIAILLCNALTTGYLHPVLTAAKVSDPERFVIWFDPSKLLVRRVDPGDADLAFDRMAISYSSYRAAKGFGEEDAPDAEEMAARIAIEKIRRRRPGKPGSDEAPVEARPGPPADDEPEPEIPEALIAAATSDLGERLAEIDRDLRTRLHAAVDGQMRRTLERAGASLRSKASSSRTTADAVSQVANDKVAATLGQAVVQSLGIDEIELVSGSFDGLAERFDAWVSRAAKAGLALVPGLSEDRAKLVTAELDRLRGEAWSWLVAELERQAIERLYSPQFEAGDGEADSTSLVPFGTVREAVARAGGAAERNVTADGLGALGPLAAVLGLVTGWLFRETFDDHDVSTVAWRWVYGPFPRDFPFEPHRRLNGKTFDRFDDPMLANPGLWPSERFLTPGDHIGCFCDWVPVMSEAGVPSLPTSKLPPLLVDA